MALAGSPYRGDRRGLAPLLLERALCAGRPVGGHVGSGKGEAPTRK